VVIRYRETQRFPLWADLLFWSAGVMVPLGIALALPPRTPDSWVMWTVAPAMLLVYLGLFRMKTEVSDTSLTVAFGWIPFYRWSIPLGEIATAEEVTYNPLKDYGGWGIRGIPVAALNARGDRGVLLHLKTGRTLLIGSQAPEALLLALTSG
jgi:hypothetical protein